MNKKKIGLIGRIKMDNLIDVLLETAFKEVNKSVDKHDKEIYDLKTLVYAMDKKIDDIIATQNRLIEAVNLRANNDDDYYNSYKNGENE